MEKISVIIPVYNMEKYLNRCINSVINQTYKNLEIILVNDGSTDNSADICNYFLNKDSRIKVINKKNGGLSDARNAGIAIASGEYISFLDSDDWIDLDYYEVLYKSIVENNADIAIIGFLWVKENKFYKPPFYLENRILTSKEAIKELAKDEFLTSHAWNKLFKREFFNDIKFPYGRTYEDVFIMHKIFSQAKKILIISDFKYYYYMHNDSIIHTPKAKNLIDKFFAFKSRYNDLRDEYTDIEYNMIKSIYNVVIEILYVHPLNSDAKNKYKSEIKEIKKFISNKSIMNKLGIKGKLLNISPKLFGIIRNNRNIMPNKIKKEVKKLLIKNNNSIELDKGENRIILCGSPEYGNIGDLAIAYFTKRFMEINSNKKFIEITEKEINYNFNEIAKKIKPSDIILLQGGGNLGSEYVDQEKIRSKVIKLFKNNKIIIMPQTVYFSEDAHGQAIKECIKKIYSQHKDLNIFSREEISFKTMNKIFNNNNINLVPDIVMSSTIKFDDNINRSGAMLCLRSDVEGILNVDDLINIKDKISKKFKKYYMNDTVYDYNIELKKREEVLYDFWNRMRRAEVVITDRLHGMIFAAITGTPCVVIGNYNHKVKTCYNWFKELEYIKFCNSVSEIENAINEINYSKTYTYPGDSFMKKFESMKKLIGG